MKTFILLIYTFSVLLAVEESQQLSVSHPLQDTYQSSKLLCQMRSDLMTYLYETPLSSYEFFNTYSDRLQSEPITTWVHGDVYIHTLAAHKGPLHAIFKDAYKTHMGDYRYDIFTLLNDLLLTMQYESDFSGAKEKAILSTFIDSYFEKIKNVQAPCPCSDDALNNIYESDLLSQYTTLEESQRLFNFHLESLSHPTVTQTKQIKHVMKRYASEKRLDPMLDIKSIAIDSLGNYLLLCEGTSTDIRDDLLLALTAETLPTSYRIDSDMKKTFKDISLMQRIQATSKLIPDNYTGVIKINNRNFILSKLNPSLQLRPQSEKTRSYMNYASALGFMLASFHSDVRLKACRTFAKKINQEVKTRQMKVEMIGMVYAYNEQLEKRWASFGERYTSSCKTQLLSDIR
jgi:uncharacterized protein (DUF2252 family)